MGPPAKSKAVALSSVAIPGKLPRGQGTASMLAGQVGSSVSAQAVPSRQTSARGSMQTDSRVNAGVSPSKRSQRACAGKGITKPYWE